MKFDAVCFLLTLSIAYAIRLQNSVPEPQHEKRRINRKINAGESIINLGESTLEVLRSSGAAKSKTLLLYTTSGDPRQLESLCLNAALLQREGIPEVLRDIDVLVYDNSGTDADGMSPLEKRGLPKTPIGPVISPDLAPPQERRRGVAHCLENFTYGQRNMYMSSSNIGYRMGAVQAMDKLFQHQIFTGYDWVIHIHPDVFILNPFPLARTLTRNTTKDVITGRFYPRCYTFNFFAFRPHKVNKNGFSAWNTSKDIPECYLKRVAFKNIHNRVNLVYHDSQRASVNIQKLSHMDRFGMWHHHDPSVIRKELNSRPTLVNVTDRDFKIDTNSSETDTARSIPEETSSHEFSYAGPVMDMLRSEVNPEDKADTRKTTNAFEGEHQQAATEKLSDVDHLSAEIYVINLKSRDDRWKCVKGQLEHTKAPFNYTRFNAIEAHEVSGSCPHLRNSLMKQGGPAQGVMCSNYMIWKHALKTTSAKYIIIFEDDIAMSEDIWTKVGALFTGDCKERFDYIAVDTFSGTNNHRRAATPHGEPKNRFCKDAAPGHDLHALAGQGAQMQIIRRDAIPVMMKNARKRVDVPLDQLNHKMGFHGVRTAMFQARVAAQFQSAVKQKVEGITSYADVACSDTVQRSNINR